MVHTFRRLLYLFICKTDVGDFPNHRILLFVSHPTGIDLPLARQKVLKAIRWVLYTSVFYYEIEHEFGYLNTMVITMTR